jgi:hypothetical protein
MKKWVSNVKEWFRKLFVKVETKALEKLVREKLALSPRDLCDHNFAVKQVWTRVAIRKYELQNEITCVKCKDQRVVAIR